MTTLDNAKKELVIKALVKHEGNRVKAAKDLGVCVRSMRNYINTYGIDIPPPAQYRTTHMRGKAMGALYQAERALVLVAQSTDNTTAAKILGALENVKNAVNYLKGEDADAISD